MAAVLQFAEGEVFLDGKPVEFQKGIIILVENSSRLDTKKGADIPIFMKMFINC